MNSTQINSMIKLYWTGSNHVSNTVDRCNKLDGLMLLLLTRKIIYDYMYGFDNTNTLIGIAFKQVYGSQNCFVPLKL